MKSQSQMPATCNVIRAGMQDLLDGVVEPAPESPQGSLRTRIDAHASVCDSCREEWADLQSVQAALARLPRLQAPARMWEGISRRIERDAAASRAPSRLERWFHDYLVPVWPAVAGAAALWIVGVGIAPISSTSDGQPVPPMAHSIVLAQIPRNSVNSRPLSARGGGGSARIARVPAALPAGPGAAAPTPDTAGSRGGLTPPAASGVDSWSYVESQFAAYTRRLRERSAQR